MQRWPRDQKLKPEVNSRDVIKWMYEAYVRRSILVTITDIWTKFGTEHKYHTMNTPDWPNSYQRKIQDGCGLHFEFRRNVNNSELDKYIYTKANGNMHHGHAEMTSWPKVETGS